MTIGLKVGSSVSRVRAVAIITEDESDYWPIRILIQRIANSESITFKGKFGNGSGKLVGKCHAWSRELHIKGCDLLIIVHDLDTDNYSELNKLLNDKLKDSPIKNRYICIPVKELEAWFLADIEAIKKAFNIRHFSKIKGLPENINKPKETLINMIYRQSGNKIPYTTMRGKEIAVHLDLTRTATRAKSFKDFKEFISLQSF